MNENKLIQACDKCLKASCWYGDFMCEDAYSSDCGVTLKTIKELRELKYESEHYWSNEYMESVYGEPNPFGNKGRVSESCGDLFSKEEFVKNVECGGFIDYDGFGYYSDGEYEYRGVYVYPSAVLQDGFNDKYTHVVWYNR